MSEMILIVDDEETVRKTFQEWLRSSNFGCEVVAVGDAESALVVASKTSIDLAILDWNLGSGSDGLQLLEDLVEFHPDLVAILVTGFAHQATPLQALRMGVRDYLDKNQDLNREMFLNAVKRQLDKILPAKRQRKFTQSLQAFRDALEKVLPLVQGTAKLNDPVPLSQAIQQLFRFLAQTTQAQDGVLLIRQMLSDQEKFLVYSFDGQPLPPPTIPFARSLAATVVSMQEPCILNQLDSEILGSVDLQPFERDHRNLMLAPLPVGPGTHVVLELFDKPSAFTEQDKRLVDAACGFGTEMIRQSMAEKESQTMLLQAIEAAMKASDKIAGSLPMESDSPLPSPSEAIMSQLREGLASSTTSVVDAGTSLRLTEAIRALAVRHGNPAVEHCLHLVESLRRLLDEMTGYLDR